MEMDITNIDKFDIEILYCLFVNDCISQLKSFKVNEIINNTDLKSAYYTYVNRLKKLISKEYIDYGFKDGNAKTYFITKEGIRFLSENVLNKEEIYEEIEEE
nr:MAG TPA: endonuclease-like protein [Caudoviricetes sp.]